MKTKMAQGWQMDIIAVVASLTMTMADSAKAACPIPAGKQTATSNQKPIASLVIGDVTAASVVVGQRQSTSSVSGRPPTQRIDSRIENRLGSRLSNRIDETYCAESDLDPRAAAMRSLSRSSR